MLTTNLLFFTYFHTIWKKVTMCCIHWINYRLCSHALLFYCLVLLFRTKILEIWNYLLLFSSKHLEIFKNSITNTFPWMIPTLMSYKAAVERWNDLLTLYSEKLFPLLQDLNWGRFILQRNIRFCSIPSVWQSLEVLFSTWFLQSESH